MWNTVTLEPSERRIVDWIGKSRNAANIDAGTQNRRACDKSDDAINILGVGGEFAFCKLVNAMPDFTIGVRQGGVDLTLPVSGRAVDVKSTDHVNRDTGLPDGNLVIEQGKLTRLGSVEIFVLMRVCGDQFIYCGWIEYGAVISDRGRENSNQLRLKVPGYVWFAKDLLGQDELPA